MTDFRSLQIGRNSIWAKAPYTWVNCGPANVLKQSCFIYYVICLHFLSVEGDLKDVRRKILHVIILMGHFKLSPLLFFHGNWYHTIFFSLWLWREVKKRFGSNLLELGTFKWKCGDYICEPTKLWAQIRTYQLSSKICLPTNGLKTKCPYFALPLKTRDFSSSFFHPCTLCQLFVYIVSCLFVCLHF